MKNMEADNARNDGTSRKIATFFGMGCFRDVFEHFRFRVGLLEMSIGTDCRVIEQWNWNTPAVGVAVRVPRRLRRDSSNGSEFTLIQPKRVFGRYFLRVGTREEAQFNPKWEVWVCTHKEPERQLRWSQYDSNSIQNRKEAGEGLHFGTGHGRNCLSSVPPKSLLFFPMSLSPSADLNLVGTLCYPNNPKQPDITLFTIDARYVHKTKEEKNVPTKFHGHAAFFEIASMNSFSFSREIDLFLKDIPAGQVNLSISVVTQADETIFSIPFNTIEFPPMKKNNSEVLADKANWKADKDKLKASNKFVELISHFSCSLDLKKKIALTVRLVPALFAIRDIGLIPPLLRACYDKALKSALCSEKEALQQQSSLDYELRSAKSGLESSELRLEQAQTALANATEGVERARKRLREVEEQIEGEQKSKRRRMEEIEAKLQELDRKV